MPLFLLIVAAVQAASPPPSAGGMVSNSVSSRAISVPAWAMPPLPIAVPAAPDVGPGRHELVVHWPDAAPSRDYRRSFRSGAACLKARAAVLEEHRARMAAIAVNLGNSGVVLAVELEAPYAVCVPVE